MKQKSKLRNKTPQKTKIKDLPFESFYEPNYLKQKLSFSLIILVLVATILCINNCIYACDIMDFLIKHSF